MMEVFVNGVKVELDTSGVQTVGEILGIISRDLDVKYRIVRAMVDGVDITGNADSHMQPKSGAQKIEVKTGLASELAKETLTSIQEFHESLDKELSRTADEFRMGSTEKSNELFVRCLDGLQILIKMTVSVANLLQVKSSEVNAGSDSMQQIAEKLSNVFQEMIEAQINRDGILLADLIEYELNPLLEDWGTARESLMKITVAA